MKLLIDMPVLPDGLEILLAIPGVEVDCIDVPADVPREIPAERLRGVEGLFCSHPPTNFSDFNKLRWIQLSSTGYSQIFGLDLVQRGIHVTNARGCFDVPIAEWTISMMINLKRNIRQMIRNQEQGIWDRSALFQSELRGSVVGFWGYGGIGRECARLSKQMGLQVHVFTRSGVVPRDNIYSVPGTGDPSGILPEETFVAGQERDFLNSLDFLVLSLPLTKATEGLIGAERLKQLPEKAFVLNPSRGPIIQRQALIDALNQGWIAGAAVDTHYQYPTPPDDPLWHMPNVIFTPHISGSSLNPNFLKRIWDIKIENVRRWLENKPLLNELSTSQIQGE